MKKLFALVIWLVMSATAFTQGCSDAGFCSIGPLKSSIPSSAKHRLALGAGYGIAEENTSVVSSYLEYSWKYSENWNFQAKLTAGYASGFLGNNLNAGDVYASATYSFKNSAGNLISLLSGFKIPLTTANDKYNGRPLPMDYQSSIGTYDYLAGINYSIRSLWELSGGLQIPLIQVNKNSFYPDEYQDIKAASFAPTNNFKRKPDALIRAAYNYQAGKNITLKPNLLAIYHLGKDSYEDRFGRRQSIEGSQGLTLNAGISAVKVFKNQHQIEILAATPFIVREVRADGLTRSAVLNLQYSFPL